MKNSTILKSILASIGITTLGLGAFIAVVWYFFAGPGYYLEMNAVREKLEAMPNVEIVSLRGHEDVTLEDIWATIRIKGKGEVSLYSLERRSFEHDPTILIGRIGDCDLFWNGKGKIQARDSETREKKMVRADFYGGTIGLGEEGAFSHLFPFEVNTVQDVVDHYDDILAIVSQWPSEDAKQHFKDERGHEYNFYVVKTSDSVGNQL